MLIISLETPYQGKKRSFGDFCCHQCDRTWSSGNPWADMGQKCKFCEPESDDEEHDSGKPYLSHLCEKCKKLGYNCRRRYPKRY